MNVFTHKSRDSIRKVPMVWLVVMLTGCMTISPPAPTTSWRTIDSPAPLTAHSRSSRRENADEYAVRRPLPPESRRNSSPPPRKGESIPLPKSAESAVADPDEPPAPVFPSFPETPSDREPGSGPAIEAFPKVEPDEVSVGSPLELTVAAPARRQVGGEATYRIVLRNLEDRPHERLILRCRFGDGLVFAGSDKREVLQRVERLLPGETRELALSLTSDRIGSQCCRFAVARRDADEEIEIVSRQTCVDFVDGHVDVDLVGPAQRTAGSRAEFNIILSNRSLKTIDEVRALVSFDKALVLKEATAQGEQKPGSLVWRLGSLRSMERVYLQVEFECLTPAHRASIAVDIKGGGLPGEHEEACVEIIPVPGYLDLQIGDRNDPLEIGKTGIYEATVQNVGLQSARRVVIEAAIPQNVKVRSASVRAGGQLLSVAYAAEGDKLVFEPVDQLEPNGRLVYSVEVEALSAGPADFRATLTSSLGGAAVVVSEPTMIVEP